MESNKNYKKNITYELINKCLGHPGKNNKFKSTKIIVETISTTTTYIIPFEEYELSMIWFKEILKSTSLKSKNTLERI